VYFWFLKIVKMSIAHLIRANIKALAPYSSARSEFKGAADIFLDANENPFETGLNRYPDPLQWEVKQRISQLKGIGPEHIFLGNGSDEVIDLLIRVFCEPREDHIIILPPTYGMYKVSSGIADVALKEVSLTPDFQPDVETILAQSDPHSKLLFLCSPNNPTANSFSPDLIHELCRRFTGIVVIDEAYIDFSDQPSFTATLPQYSNLVVMQTFSKAWGLAGIRLGMAFASEEIIALLNKVKPPYNINQLTQRAALKALESPEKQAEMVDILLKERARLEVVLTDLSFVEKVFPSDANFLLIRVPDALGLYNALVREKIIVRNRSNVHLCAGGIRISIGRPEENDRLIHVLQTLTR
jgi:histidinol-phosphate aminotransferase